MDFLHLSTFSMDFTTINYLKTGTPTQQKTYTTLTHLNIFNDLKKYNPILVGTIPIDIQTSKSDLDIILETNHVSELADCLTKLYKNLANFNLEIKNLNQHILACNFWFEDFEIEIYSQNMATQLQNGYLHMIKEYEILQAYSNDFKQHIISLKQQGIKTEPAFAQLLNLKGNPYEALLHYHVKKKLIKSIM
jgi:hypothetical protein